MTYHDELEMWTCCACLVQATLDDVHCLGTTASLDRLDAKLLEKFGYRFPFLLPVLVVTDHKEHFLS